MGYRCMGVPLRNCAKGRFPRPGLLGKPMRSARHGEVWGEGGRQASPRPGRAVVTSRESSRVVDMKLEVVVLPFPDVERAKDLYGQIDWQLDADFPFDNGFRVVQFTPPARAARFRTARA
jgi:hypothetical protein